MAEEEQNRDAYLQIIEGVADLDGRFTRIKRLGNIGGGGVWSLVFDADDGSTGQRVAIKVYNPHQRSHQYRLDSFRREALLLSEFAGQKDIIGLVSPMSELIHRIDLPGGSSTR